MEQIRARIREKRGVDYTEQQIRELAAVKLEKFLDPRGVRSDLLEQFRKAQPAYEPPELPNYAFEDATLFESHRGAAPVDPPAAAADPQAVLQPESADPGAAHPVAPEHDERRARGAARSGAAAMRPAVLRADPQPRPRDDAARHRGQEPEDARRVADEPPRVQRAARARARKRRRLQAVGRRRAAPQRRRRPQPRSAAAAARRRSRGASAAPQRRRQRRRGAAPAAAAPAPPDAAGPGAPAKGPASAAAGAAGGAAAAAADRPRP